MPGLFHRGPLTCTYFREAGRLPYAQPMSGCPITKPVDEGIDAYCKGVPRSACPYAPGTPQHRDWLCGWDEAEEIDRDENGERPLGQDLAQRNQQQKHDDGGTRQAAGEPYPDNQMI